MDSNTPNNFNMLKQEFSMSDFKTARTSNIATMLVSAFSATIAKAPSNNSVVGSMENYTDPVQAQSAADAYDVAEMAVTDDLKTTLAADKDVDVSEITEEDIAPYKDGIEAAAIVLMSQSNLKSMREAAKNAQGKSGLISVSPISGSYGSTAPVASIEAFDTNAIDTYKSESITYNLSAARQDAFSEMFYRTYIGTPDQAMFKACIDRVMIAPRVQHTLDGEVKDFGKRNLLEVYRDNSILDDNSTDLVPVVDSKNTAKFVPTSVAPNREVVVDGHTFNTRPLAVNTEIGMIGISSHPGLIAAGLMDQNEAVDHNAGVKSLLLKVTKGEETEYLDIDVSRLPGAKFIKSSQGHGFDTTLALRTVSLLNPTVLTSTGAASTILAPLYSAGKTVSVRILVNGNLNLERSGVEITPGSCRFVQVTDATGKEIAIANETAIAGVEMEIVGWEPDMRRTNSTRRSAGHLIEMDRWEEIYPVGLLAPLVSQDPVAPYTTDSKVKGLIMATHAKINSAAVTALLNTAEHLEQVVDQNQGGFLTADSQISGSVEGIARFVTKPHFRRTEVDLEQVVNNISSKDKLRDIQGYFIALLNEAGYRMIQNTGIRIAARSLNGGIDKEVKLLIGTDEVLPAFMMIQGDDRNLGIKLKYQIESASDQRMFGKIVLALGQDGTGFMPLNFGNFLWIPELISEVPVNRNGTTIKETMVQPRFRHICNVPAMEVIDVVGLTPAIANKLSIAFVDKTPVTPEVEPDPLP